MRIARLEGGGLPWQTLWTALCFDTRGQRLRPCPSQKTKEWTQSSVTSTQLQTALGAPISYPSDFRGKGSWLLYFSMKYIQICGFHFCYLFSLAHVFALSQTHPVWSSRNTFLYTRTRANIRERSAQHTHTSTDPPHPLAHPPTNPYITHAQARLLIHANAPRTQAHTHKRTHTCTHKCTYMYTQKCSRTLTRARKHARAHAHTKHAYTPRHTHARMHAAHARAHALHTLYSYTLHYTCKFIFSQAAGVGMHRQRSQNLNKHAHLQMLVHVLVCA